jgi:competence protein ComEC
LLGILLFSPSINSYLIRFIPEKISSSLASSISAVIFTSPISLHVFGFISLSGIISTLFASALITLFLYLGIFLFVLCLFIPCFEFFSNFSMNLIYKLIFEIVKIFDFLPQIYI